MTRWLDAWIDRWLNWKNGGWIGERKSLNGEYMNGYIYGDTWMDWKGWMDGCIYEVMEGIGFIGLWMEGQIGEWLVW